MKDREELLIEALADMLAEIHPFEILISEVDKFVHGGVNIIKIEPSNEGKVHARAFLNVLIEQGATPEDMLGLMVWMLDFVYHAAEPSDESKPHSGMKFPSPLPFEIKCCGRDGSDEE